MTYKTVAAQHQQQHLRVLPYNELKDLWHHVDPAHLTESATLWYASLE